jgi:hypothetical protein
LRMVICTLIAAYCIQCMHNASAIKPLAAPGHPWPSRHLCILHIGRNVKKPGECRAFGSYVVR